MTSQPLPRRIAAQAVAAALMACTAKASAQDPLQARNLAATCANCHGTHGQAVGEMRSLAGLSAERIVASVADFRNGNPPTTIMQQIAKGYSDEQIRLIAGWFAAQPARP